MRPSNRLSIVPALLLLLVVPGRVRAQESDSRWLERCEESHDRREVFCEIRPVTVAATGSLDLESSNGVIDLRGRDQADVQLRARIRGWGETVEEARANARDVRIVVNGGQVRADGPTGGRGEGWSVDFIGTLPRRYNLTIETENGPVSVRDVTGRMDVETSNGPLDLQGISGEVRARTSNGPLTLELTDTRVADSGIDVRTSNGPLTVVLPRSINARLEAETDNGPISTDFDVDIRRHSRHTVSGEIDATLGDGGGTIRARTSNGPLTVRAD